MIFYLMRHGKAEDFASSDEARALTPVGVERTKQAAKVLKKMGIQPKVIYSSPRVRAEQTARIVADKLGMSVTIRDEVNFNFQPAYVARLMEGYVIGDELMFVGHNPSISETVEGLTGARVDLRKGAVACIEFMGRLNACNLLWLADDALFSALE